MPKVSKTVHKYKNLTALMNAHRTGAEPVIIARVSDGSVLFLGDETGELYANRPVRSLLYECAIDRHFVICVLLQFDTLSVESA